MKKKKEKILVTGASGFLGSNILKRLKKKNFKILAGHNSKKNLITSKNITPIKFNLENFRKKSIEKYNISKLIHLAWPNLENFTDPSHQKKILNDQKKFIEKMIKAGCKNLIVAGTCYEYGLINGKIKETRKTKPYCSYGIGKDMLRKYLLQLKKKYKFKLTWFRVFFIYGANLSRTTLTNILLKSKKLNNTIVLNKKIKRDYIDIDFVADVFTKTLENDKDYGVVNLASGKKISLRDLVKLLSSKYKISPKVKYEDTRQRAYEPESFYGCNKKLTKIMRINKYY